MVKLQEAENQIITDYEVYARRPCDSDLLIAAIETHQALLGRTPSLVAADAAFYCAKNEAAAKAKGVKRVCIPNRSTKSLERKREQRKRWFRNGQKWRTGCEGLPVGPRGAEQISGLFSRSFLADLSDTERLDRWNRRVPGRVRGAGRSAKRRKAPEQRCHGPGHR